MAKVGPCLWSFFVGCSILLIPLCLQVSDGLKGISITYWLCILLAKIIAVNSVALPFYQRYDYQVFLRGHLLGVLFSLGLILSLSTSSVRLFGWYVCTLAFFHWSEYMTTALTNPSNLSLQSYLLDHSVAYYCAMVASCVEFSVEAYFVPAWKTPGWLHCAGLCVVIAGESLRKAAMFTARTNFNHHVRYVRDSSHELVTHGVFSLFRHPSYVGWFYWSVGSQVMLANPVCTMGYFFASWSFFKSRVESEELTLLYFFGEDYAKYQRRVGTGLPLIHGVKCNQRMRHSN